MMPSRSSFISLAAVMLIALGAPESVLATTRIVNPADASCSTSTTPPCYTSITAALAAAASGDVIEIRPGTYTGTYTITQQLTITGTETARTILSGGGAGPIFTVDGAANVAIRRLSFTNATTGILAQNSSSITITNNVFRVGTSGAGVVVESTSTAVVDNNTFYQNLNALTFASGTTVTIRNNIFSTNAGTAVSTVAAALSIHNNCYFGNNANGQLTTDIPTTDVTTDPLFVSTGSGDFHLRSGSPCIDAGDTAVGSDRIDSTAADIGAYGGLNSDTIPFPVSDLAITSTGAGSISLSWSTNHCYQIGGYNVYYGESSGTHGTTIPNVGTVAGDTVTYTIAGLASATPPTGAPTLSHSIVNQTLLLTWDTIAVSGATGYEVRYELDGPTVTNACPYVTVPTVISPHLDAANTTAYALTGLQNNTCYSVNVVPYALARYYIITKAFYAANTSYLSTSSNEVNHEIGTIAYDLTTSNVIHDYPELITPMPNLPNSGNCFIATAAYGHYSAPQVRALREFRDRYLMTNEPGRAFVRWYYRYGPIGAEFMQAHPWLKPIVRITLLPIVGGALCITQTSYITKALFVLFGGSCLLCVILVYRDRKKKT